MLSLLRLGYTNKTSIVQIYAYYSNTKSVTEILFQSGRTRLIDPKAWLECTMS
jgi:hypothetical protein